MKALFIGIITVFTLCSSFLCNKTLETRHTQPVTVDFTNVGAGDRAVITYEGEDGQGTYVFDSQDHTVITKHLKDGLYTLTYALYSSGGSCSVFYNYADGGRVALNEGSNSVTNPIPHVDPMEENTFDTECR